MPAESVIAAIIRKGKLVIPHGDTELQPADEVLAVVHASQVSALAERLGR
jgi:trk system potassium uptake protein TrkA